MKIFKVILFSLNLLIAFSQYAQADCKWINDDGRRANLIWVETLSDYKGWWCRCTDDQGNTTVGNVCHREVLDLSDTYTGLGEITVDGCCEKSDSK